jgi:hypothetical protein
VTSRHFKVGDILTRDNEYYGLIVSERCDFLDSIYLLVLNKSSHVRQLNILYSEWDDYAYKVINV